MNEAATRSGLRSRRRLLEIGRGDSEPRGVGPVPGGLEPQAA